MFLKRLILDDGPDNCQHTLAPLTLEEFALTDYWHSDVKASYQAWCHHHGFKALSNFHPQELKHAKIVLIDDPGTKLYYSHDKGQTWNLITSPVVQQV